MVTRSPLVTVDRQEVIGILKATNSRDPDVLHAAKTGLLAEVKFPKAVGVYLIVLGVMCTATILLSIIGIPMIIAGFWIRHRGVRNVRTVENAYADYAKSATVLIALLAMLGGGRMAAQASPQRACGGVAACYAARDYSATITSFQQSTLTVSSKAITTTLRFENRGNAPLHLGYVTGSGVIIDDEGNRYIVYGPTAVRGLGEIANGTFDPKFSLAPGEAADARLEFVLNIPAGRILGTRYTMELALREITPVAGGQFRLGREYALRYEGLPSAVTATTASGGKPATSKGTGSSGTPADGAPNEGGSADASPAAPPSPPVDHCLARVRCHDAGAFSAEVSRATASMAGGRHHVLELVVRFRNFTAAPLALAYRSGTNGAVDELGNRYYFGRAGTHDGSAKGIGLATTRSADARFVLRPGEQREAVFTVVRYEARGQMGTRWNWSTVIDELEVLPSNQVRTAREHSVTLDDIPLGSAPSAKGLMDAAAKLLKKK